MKSAIVELHDVSPYHRSEFLRALELLEEVGCNKYSLLLVPYFWERSSLVEDKEFVHILKSSGAELLLHGYTHKGKKRVRDFLWTDGEGEFGGLDLQETYERVHAGLELLNYLGIKTHFFVPPAWIGNPYLEDVLYSLGFRGVAYRWYIKDLLEGVLIKSPALTFSNRPVFSWLSLQLVKGLEKAYSRYELLRLALHMADFRDQRKVTLWKDILQEIKRTRRWTSYGEVFGKGGPSPALQGFQPAGWLVQ